MYRSFVFSVLCCWSLVAPSIAQESIPFSWDNATVYFVMTDRFANGDPSNDQAYGRGLDGEGQPYTFDANGHFHGGDFQGLTQKIKEGYFTQLGVNALWITAPYEQVHGWVGGATDVQAYAYHGYWPLDFTEMDANLGTWADFQTFVDTAHANGLRVVMDVVLNHVGYATLHDLDAFGIPTIKDESWKSWRPGPDESWLSYHDRFFDYADSTDWAHWWGSDWVRAGLPAYTACGSDDYTQCLASLPDVRTETIEEVALPPVLLAKWDEKKLVQEQAELDAFFARTGLPRSPRNYIIKWLTDWVAEFGIDGFRIDTAKHVELEAWQALKTEATQALSRWKARNPDKALDDTDFWMTGEVWGHGVERTAYFDHGFDSVINFAFQDAAGDYAALDSIYAHYDQAINPDPSFNVLSYLSSHDTHLFDRNRLMEGGTSLLLLPGSVQIFYGDESARPPLPPSGVPDANTRSFMNWDSPNAEVLAHWQMLGQFRNRHPALAAGEHVFIADAPYTFGRTLDYGNLTDRVVIVLGATGSTNVNVASVFPDNAIVRDAYTGNIGFVSYGLVTLDAHPNGVMLLEEVQ